MQKSKLSIFILIILYIFIIRFNYKTLDSYYIQKTLLEDIEASTYSSRSWEFIKDIDLYYPSVTNTAIPYKAIVGAYYYEKDSIEKGIKLLKDSRKDNPFLMFAEAKLSDIYSEQNELDSFLFYSNKSFKELPNNPVHFIQYSRKLKSENKLDSIVYHFYNIRKNANTNDYNLWKIVLAAFVENNDSAFVDTKEKLINEAIRLNIDNNEEVSLLIDYLRYGQKSVQGAKLLHSRGLKEFNNKNYKEAIEIIEASIDLYPTNKLFKENLIKSYYLINDYKSLIDKYEIYANQFETINSTSLFYYAVALNESGKVKESCDAFKYLGQYTSMTIPSKYIVNCN